ncbi:MAG: HD domain-containing protein [Chlamydiae bacterium]|nr:HD domain-containing protein [Chlamydiota bacterium]
MHDQLNRIFDFLKLAEKLKCELRHCDLSNGRRESVAEHVWRTSLMALVVAPHLNEKINLEKTLKMIIIHDIVEAICGDVPAFETDALVIKNKKIENEQLAISQIREMLNSPSGDEIFHLWYEFEEKETFEAKVANVLDKLEAQIQHNESDLSTWLPIEKMRVFYKLEELGEFDPFLKEFKNYIKQESIAKLEKGGCDIQSLHAEAQEYKAKLNSLT